MERRIIWEVKLDRLGSESEVWRSDQGEFWPRSVQCVDNPGRQCKRETLHTSTRLVSHCLHTRTITLTLTASIDQHNRQQ